MMPNIVFPNMPTFASKFHGERYIELKDAMSSLLVPHGSLAWQYVLQVKLLVQPGHTHSEETKKFITSEIKSAGFNDTHLTSVSATHN